eukprot:12679546-Alexandrium_andersonii.AAC.1
MKAFAGPPKDKLRDVKLVTPGSMVNNPFIIDPDPQAVPEFLSQSLRAGRRLRTRIITFTA